jgi:nucleoside-triphosphatase THEP1
MSHLHFAVKSLQDYLGKEWELFEHTREYGPEYKISIRSIITLEELTYQSIAKAFRDLFAKSIFVVDEIAGLRSKITELEKVIEQKDTEINRLGRYETYYDLHKEMKHNLKGDDE